MKLMLKGGMASPHTFATIQFDNSSFVPRSPLSFKLCFDPVCFQTQSTQHKLVASPHTFSTQHNSMMNPSILTKFQFSIFYPFVSGRGALHILHLDTFTAVLAATKPCFLGRERPNKSIPCHALHVTLL